MSSPNVNNIMAVGCIMCYACVFLLGGDSLLDEDSQITTHSTLCKVRDFLPVLFQLLVRMLLQLVVMPVDDPLNFFLRGRKQLSNGSS